MLNQKSTIPVFIPLSDAARKFSLTEQVLTQLVETGKIEAVKLPSGDFLVPANNNPPKTKEDIIDEKFADLRGQRISPYAAQKEYDGIHRSNFTRWARAGYIKILREGERLLEMDAADVAYCAYVYTQKKAEYGERIAGAKIFDKNGNPYQVKYPDLSAKRRK